MKTFFSLSRQLRSRRYDLAVDFRGDLRHLLLMRLSGIPFRVGYGITGGRFLATHSLDYPRHAHQSQVSEILLTRVGVPASDAPRSVRFDYSLAQQEMTLSKFPFLEDRAVKKIVIHTGAGYPSKKWPFEKFRQVINEVLNRELAAVILIGSREEKHANPLEEAANRKTYDLRGESGLEDLPVIVDFSNLYLGNDSGPGHIAAAQGGPVLILFSGVNRSEIWRPVGPGVNLIRHEVPCSPCEMPVCPLKHQDCMNKIELDAVMNQITIMLSEKKGQLHV
ncbi:MAG: hypothetical protein A2Z83_05045 [Omnitrophica bacterium GWA2_52_8]|nr:MAG: hypothetical protein A2Z83_05045 [Omnitrophica bacterium GWA2_52_8]